MDFLDTLLKETEEAESPTSFMYWAALSAVSAVVNNKVWVKRGRTYKTFLNTYVITIAKSGMRKGYPISVSKNLIQEVNNTRIISGRASFQSIIHELSQAKPIPGGGLIKDAICAIISGEMSTSLVRDQDALTILTDLHDTDYHQKGWVNSLKGSGKETLTKPCITLLGAMNHTHFKDLITDKEITGGFIARCILVVETKRSKKNPMVDDDDSDDLDYAKLALPLKEFAKLNGPMVLSPDARIFYKDWYKDWEPEEMEDKTGTANRIHENIMKTAGLLSIARKGKLVIELDALKEAFDVVLKSGNVVDKLTVGQGSDKDYSRKLSIFLSDLLAAPEYTIERSKILSKNYGNFDKWDLDRIVEHVQESGGIEIIHEGLKQSYRLTKKTIESLEAHQRRQGFKVAK